eukprot:TRINITY_DN2826_c0_g2_i1.p1 TRINITY_DN2826_c0_g2~~TRINITY_DN2826_c0_g2_i1.p1  ORF type:complete len:442 (-),score=90.86 TRINITY_DN2826_c0_g2_i1:160-1485(-)
MAHAYAAGHAFEAGARYPPAPAGWPEAALGLHGYGVPGHPPVGTSPYGVPGVSPYAYHAGMPPQLHPSAASSAWYHGLAAGYDAHLYASGVQAKLPLPPAPGQEHHHALMLHALQQQAAHHAAAVAAAAAAAAAAAPLGQLPYPLPHTPPLHPSDPMLPVPFAAPPAPPGVWSKAAEERGLPPPVLPQGLEAPPGISAPAVRQDASSRQAELGELMTALPQKLGPSNDPGAAAGAYLLNLMNKDKALGSSGAALLEKLQKGTLGKPEDPGSAAGMALLQQVQSGSPPRTADADYSGQWRKGPGKGKGSGPAGSPGEWRGGEDDYAGNDYYGRAGYYDEAEDASWVDHRWAKGGKASKKGKNAEWTGGWNSADNWSGDWIGSEEWQDDMRWRPRRPAPAESKTKSAPTWIASPQSEDKAQSEEKPKLRWRPVEQSIAQTAHC